MKRGRNPLVWKHVRAGRRLRQSDISMTPIMNLFMILIPFLLMAASFVQYSILHSAVTQEGGQTSTRLRPGLIVEIDANRFTLVSRTCDIKRVLEGGGAVAGSGRVPFEGHSHKALLEALRRVKESFPDEKEITLAPLRETPYQLVIHTMDTVREYRDGNTIKALFPNIAFIGPRPQP